jgi:hypothetical protein
LTPAQRGVTLTSVARSYVDEKTWNKILEGYRNGRGHKGSAAFAGVLPKTAKHAYERGYPERGPWGEKPIKQLLEEERELAASRLQHVKDREHFEEDRALLASERDREAMRQRAIDVHAAEAKMIATARTLGVNAMAPAIALAKTEGLQLFMQRAGQSFAALATQPENLTKKDVEHGILTFRRLMSAYRDLADMQQKVMEMERLHNGQPTQVIGVVDEVDTMPMDDLARLAGYQDGLLQRAAQHGFVVLPGGRGPVVDAESYELELTKKSG